MTNEKECRCELMISKGFRKNKNDEWVYYGFDGECYKCTKNFIKNCDEWGATNMIGKKGEIMPIEFCYDCWEDEVENSIENTELGIMVWKNKLN
tara:strand:- start:2044 stop:2325 length:282 start_codon:yes stop_codon:yes gene_type:complete